MPNVPPTGRGRGNRTSSHGHASSGRVELLGRGAELSRLQESVSRALSESGRAVIVVGEAGVGKSALVRALSAALKGSAPVPVRSGRGDPLAGGRDHGVLLEALDRRSARLGIAPSALPPEAASSALASVDRRAPPGTRETLLAVFDELAEASPQILLLEDLHWADEASLELLGAIGRRLGATRTALVATARALRASPALADLVTSFDRAGVLELVELARLPDEVARSLASSMLGAPIGPRLRREVDRAGGNPLLVQARLAELEAEGAIVIDRSGRAVLARRPSRSSLPVDVVPHLQHVADATRDLLGVASVLGVAFEVRHLRAMTGPGPSPLVAALREATAAGVLTGDAGSLRFAHPMVRDALYEGLMPELRAELHRTAAVRLEAAGAPPSAVAEHVLRAGLLQDDAHRLARLAPTAISDDPATARALLVAGAGLLAPGASRHEAVLAALAAAELASSRPTEAESVARQLLETGTSAPVVAQARAWLGQALLDQELWAETRDQVDAWLASADVEQSERAELLALGAAASLALGRMREADALVCDAEREAGQAGERRASAAALTVRGQLAIGAGDYRGATALLHAAVAAGRSGGRAGAAVGARASGWLAIALVEQGELDAAEKLVDEARWTGEGSAPATAALLGTVSAYVSLAAGALGEVLDELEAQQRLEELGTPRWTSLGAAIGCLAALWRDGPTAARPWAARLQASGLPAFAIGCGIMARALAALALAEGDGVAALERLVAAWHHCSAVPLVLDAVAVGPSLAWLGHRQGRDELAAAVSQRLDGFRDENPDVVSLRAAALMAAGIARRDAGAIRGAAVAFRSAGRLVAAGHADGAAALLFGGQGRRADADAAAGCAVADLEGAGATYELRRFRALARAEGVPLPLPRRRDAATGLTRTERIVARYVAEGLSNPEIAERMFLSRRTVESHMSQILRKLHLTSRTELALAVARGALPQG